MKLLSLSKNINKLKEIFIEMNVEVFTSIEECNTEIDFVLIEDEFQLEELQKSLSVIENNIKIISWLPVANMRAFVLSNGRLADIKGLFELNLANKAIHEIVEGDFHHETDFQNFQTNAEVITNAFQTTKNFDELAQTSFYESFDPVLIKTNVDHQMMYLAYLQQAGIGNYPMELSFSFNDLECFSTISIPVNKFSSEYIADALYSLDSQSSFSHLLTIVLNTSNHVSFTYFEQMGILKIRCFWNKYIKVSSSFQINNIQSIKTIKKVKKRNLRKFKSFMGRLKNQSEIINSIENKELPNSYLDMYQRNEEIAELLTDDDFQGLFNFVKDQVEDETKYNIKDLEAVLESFERIGSLKEVDENVVQILARKIKNENFLTAYGELIKDTEEINRVSGEKQDEIDDKMTVDFTREIINSLDITQLKNAFGEELEDEIIKIKGFVDEISNKSSHSLKPYRDEIKSNVIHKILGEKLEDNDSDFKRILGKGELSNEYIEEIIKIKGKQSQEITENLKLKHSLVEREVAQETLRSKSFINGSPHESQLTSEIENLKKQLEAYRKANNELHDKLNLYKSNSHKETYSSPINNQSHQELKKDDSKKSNLTLTDNDLQSIEVEKKKWMQEVRKRDALLERLKVSASSIDEQRLNKIRSLEYKLNKHVQGTDVSQTDVIKRKLVAAESKLDISVKAAEIYKRKFDELSTRLAKSNEKDREEQSLAIEIRSLKRMKMQSEKQVKIFEEQLKQIEKKNQELKEAGLKTLSQVRELQSQLKLANSQAESLNIVSNSKPSESEDELSNTKELAIIEELKKQNRELEEKLAKEVKKATQQSILAARKSSSSASFELKEKRMEKNIEKAREQVRKAKDEVTAAKKDLFELKNENTSLNHKLADLDREVKKYKRLMSEKKKNAA